MRAKRAGAWAVFDNAKLGPYLVPTRAKAREIYATLERGTRRIVHLTESDPAKERVFKAAMAYIQGCDRDDSTHPREWDRLWAAVEAARKGKTNKGGR